MVKNHKDYRPLTVEQCLFTESVHWADSVIEARCPSVCVSVCDNTKHPLPEVDILGCDDTIISFFFRFNVFLLLLCFSTFWGFWSQPTVDNGELAGRRVSGCDTLPLKLNAFCT